MRILLAGASGEVGRSLAAALTDLGHEVVPMTSRAPEPDSGLRTLDQALAELSAGGIDLAVHAGGRGDKRSGLRDPSTVTQSLGQACEGAGVRGVLISTVRVLEDAVGPVLGSAPAICRSDYALANARNEEHWLSAAPTYGHVLRLANYFCAPMAGDSPQIHLLPWSLVTEALADGRITVRSARGVSREFVSAHDVARAVLAIGDADSPAKIASTLPGLRLTVEQLTDCVSEAFVKIGRSAPQVSFGTDEATGPELLPDWLAEHGWVSMLTAANVTEVIAQWLSEHSSLPR